MFKEKKVQDIDNNNEPYTFTDETTREKIKRHISDINDVISENDIKNVKIPGNEKPGHLEGNRISKGGGSEGNPATPWDVVD